MARFGYSGGLVRTSVRFVSEIDRVQRRVKEKEVQVLYWLGSWTKKRMQWKLSKNPPQKETAKRGATSKRWIREVRELGTRPPWKRTGALRNLVRFEVDESRLKMVAGPLKLNKPTDTRPMGSNSTVPELLDKGGPASVAESVLTWKTTSLGNRYRTFVPTGRRIVAQYRAFPYVDNSRDEAHAKLLERLAKERL